MNTVICFLKPHDPLLTNFVKKQFQQDRIVQYDLQASQFRTLHSGYCGPKEASIEKNTLFLFGYCFGASFGDLQRELNAWQVFESIRDYANMLTVERICILGCEFGVKRPNRPSFIDELKQIIQYWRPEVSVFNIMITLDQSKTTNLKAANSDALAVNY